jgi:hypothetical protein
MTQNRRRQANVATIPNLLAEAGWGKVHSNSKSWILDCPRCTKRDKLYIRKKDGVFICWVCADREGFRGAPEYALAEITGKTISELQQVLYGYEGPTAELLLDIDAGSFLDHEDEQSIPVLPTVQNNPDFRALDSEWGLPGAMYLSKRGIPLDLALEYGIQYWPAKQRVVFPVQSKGRLLGWQSRIITPDEYIAEDGDLVKVPKALTYEGLDKSKALMFVDRITDQHAILAEGPVDALKAHLCGGNVCSMGKIVSKAQLNILKYSGIRKLYLALDPDAFEETTKLVQTLSDDLELYDMRPEQGDLGGLSLAEAHELYLGARRVTRATLFLYLKGWNDH